MLKLKANDDNHQSKLQEKENDRLKKLVTDLSKQVKVLLQKALLTCLAIQEIFKWFAIELKITIKSLKIKLE